MLGIPLYGFVEDRVEGGLPVAAQTEDITITLVHISLLIHSGMHIDPQEARGQGKQGALVFWKIGHGI